MKRAICAVLLILTLAGCGEAGHPQDGYAEGTLGDTMHTYFFDYTVERAYLCSELEGYVPAEDKELLAVEIVVENTGEAQVPMWDVDFQAGWGTEDDEVTHMILEFCSSHGGSYIGSPGNTFWVDNIRLGY